MKRTHYVTFFTIAVLISLLLCSPVLAEIKINGNLELDTSYVTDEVDDGDETTTYDSSGRIRVIPSIRKESGDLYMEALVQLTARTYQDDEGDAEVLTDDAWGKIGTSTFDFQIGRFEAWDMFPKSNDMLIVEAPTGPGKYETNYARGRFNMPGQFAVHFLPSDSLGVEIAAVYGHSTAESEEIGYDGTYYKANVMGIRPVVDFKAGNFEVLAALDYLKGTDADLITNDDDDSEFTEFGFGVAAKGTFGIATLGLNYAHGVVGGQDGAGDELNDQTTTSIGGYCDLALGQGVLTLGGIMTTREIEDDDDDDTHNQYYVSYAHPLPIEGATIKFAASSANGETDELESSEMGFKVRLYYEF